MTEGLGEVQLPIGAEGMSKKELLEEIKKHRDILQAARKANEEMGSPRVNILQPVSQPSEQMIKNAEHLVELKTKNLNLKTTLNQVAIFDKNDRDLAEQSLEKSQREIMQKIKEKANRADDVHEIDAGGPMFNSEESRALNGPGYSSRRNVLAKESNFMSNHPMMMRPDVEVEEADTPKVVPAIVNKSPTQSFKEAKNLKVNTKNPPDKSKRRISRDFTTSPKEVKEKDSDNVSIISGKSGLSLYKRDPTKNFKKLQSQNEKAKVETDVKNQLDMFKAQEEQFRILSEEQQQTRHRMTIAVKQR